MDRQERKRMTIAECLNDLMRTKDIEDITVVELCREAGISRATFYAYFEDIFAVGEWVWDHDSRHVFEGLGRDYGVYECYVRLYRLLKERSGRLDLVRPLREPMGSFTYAGLHTLKIMVERIEALRGEPLGEEERETLAYVSEAFEAVTLKWFREGMLTSPERMAKTLVEMVPPFMITTLGA